MSLREFSVRIDRRADNLAREVNKVVRNVALAVDQKVVLATPIDTGRARSNWLVSLGAPREDVIEPYGRSLYYDSETRGQVTGPIGPRGGGAGINGKGALAQARAALAPLRNSRRATQPVFITNNVAYIGRLNDGYSAQAPAMFVQQSIDIGLQTARAQIVKT